MIKASPSISATPSSTIVPLGTSSVTLNDTAVLSGGYGETGTITFTLYLGGTLKNTETVSVNGNGTYATPTGYTLPTTGTVAGLYQWDVSYSGDINNNSSSDNNAAAEQVMVVTPSTNLVNVTYTVTTPSGSKATYSDLSSVQQGDTVTANFTVPSGDYDQLTLVSYVAPQSYYSATSAYLQTVAQVATGFFSPGKGSLTVTVPASYYQIDFVYGAVISQLGLSPSDFYNAQGRMQDSDNGGTTIPSSMAGTSRITAGETASPAFWSSTSASGPDRQPERRLERHQPRQLARDRRPQLDGERGGSDQCPGRNRNQGIWNFGGLGRNGRNRDVRIRDRQQPGGQRRRIIRFHGYDLWVGDRQ